jgi:soluble lytic murein transglycosylase-like protein
MRRWIFFRLIRQESNFNPNSISHVGAQGIAQFMPGTVPWRGLADPFEPLQALYESAR